MSSIVYILSGVNVPFARIIGADLCPAGADSSDPSGAAEAGGAFTSDGGGESAAQSAEFNVDWLSGPDLAAACGRRGPICLKI